MTITNGTVEFTRRITTGDYQHKDAKVSLSFDNEDEAGIARISQMAVDRALMMVGERTHTTAAEQREGPKAGKPDILGEVNPEVGLKAGKPVRNLADIMGEVAPNPTATAAQSAAAVEQSAHDALQPAVISDKRLTDEVSSHNARLITAAGADDTQRQLATQRVLKLVDDYTQLPPGPGRLSKVPQEKRAAFLEALGALT